MKAKLVLMALALWPSATALAATLDDVKQRGVVHCGTAPNIPGYAFTDDQGNRRGFDIDLCRALAAAIFGDSNKIKLTPLAPRDAFASLQTGVVDILTHRFTWTYNRDAGSGLNFTRVMFYDGQGFMVRKRLNVTSVNQLDGASICLAQGTTSELNIADYFRSRNLKYTIVTFADLDEARRAYEEGRCDAWSNDLGSLAARGLALKNRDEHVILPDAISKEPIAPMVRQGDDQWADIARWTFDALIAAEELGITSQNVDQMKASSSPEAKRLLGVDDNLGQKNGLSADWAYNAIKQVGNYAEIFDRHLGPNTRLGMSRGRNALWKDGGLLMAPPFR
ncbi:MAG TPA: amino acid ABC transporter substrate-binding protein [Alphaproteobacteria bacterium]|jgi:general L-amino acid transport system substrate-binding protein|nr:amino acid ABC transporter substrate-binding protein [Alphaproteobacteria bacterium]